MQNIELSGSFIIGGILLVALMSLFYFYIDFSGSKRINEITKTTNIGLKEVIDYDFNKIGYRVSGTKINSMDTTSIIFNADLNNDGSAETISYSFSNNVLTRLVNPGNGRFSVAFVKRFRITGYDSTYTITDSINSVKSLNVAIVLDEQDLISDSTFFASSYIEGTYYIKN